MSKFEQELFEKRLRSIAAGFDYPRTPDITSSVVRRLQPFARGRFISRRSAWSLTILLILFSSLMLIPPARAALIEFIQIGIVRIFPRSVEPTVEVIHTAMPAPIVPLTATPSSGSSDLTPILEEIAGEMSFTEAQQVVPYPILVPAYPPDLGEPDRVYVQEAEGEMVVLVWLDPEHPGKVRMSLHFVPTNSWAMKKVAPEVIEETSVNGRGAIWTMGPYPLILSNGFVEFTRLINGNVLIWADGDITHRLETDLPLDEAKKVAESLRPVPTP